MNDASEDAYGIGYINWKEWSSSNNFSKLQKHHSAMFSAEIKKTKRGNYKDVLEVGFGSGAFLQYARIRGWNIVGVELNRLLVIAAQEAGFQAYSSIGEVADESQDLVVAFDVLEHIAESGLLAFVESLINKLRPGGCFVARFPNGDSWLGLPWQNGDTTHKTSIGTGKVEFLAKSLGLSIEFIGGQAQPIFCGSFRHMCHRMIANPFRAILEKIIRFIFFPGSRVTLMSPNMVIVLRK